MKIEIWSDVICPWCYIGKRRFEMALADFAQRDDVQVIWRSFELDTQAPRQRVGRNLYCAECTSGAMRYAYCTLRTL